MNAHTKQKQEGFTIIEVVLVLAIAALIMVVVFLAVQGAQRNQRDQARKDAANAKYESEQKSYNNQISAINESLKTVQRIMSAMADIAVTERPTLNIG